MIKIENAKETENVQEIKKTIEYPEMERCCLCPR